MTKKLTRPNWYHDEFYDKSRTPEEWLYELWKRNQFNRGEIGLPHSIHLLPMKEQEKYFIKWIFDPQIEKLLNILQPIPPQPVRYPSVSDVFIMYQLFTNTGWYKNHPRREAFESAISKIINKKTLSMEQKIAFHEMYDTPWCAFHQNHQQDNWCPKKEIAYLTGIPFSIDPSFSKEDTLTVLKRKLNACVGKPQGIQFQFPRWQQSKILAVFDLTTWFKIHGIKYTKTSLHKLIWPNDRVSTSTGIGVEPHDDMDHSIKLANRVINDNTITSLFIMCEARKFKNEMTAV